MGHLSTHVLDTMNGIPAAGMKVSLLRFAGQDFEAVKVFTLNQDGRHPQGPLLDAASMLVGRYRLLFEVGAYFRVTTTCLCWSAPGLTRLTVALDGGPSISAKLGRS